jgi:hypothetical protein
VTSNASIKVVSVDVEEQDLGQKEFFANAYQAQCKATLEDGRTLEHVVTLDRNGKSAEELRAMAVDFMTEQAKTVFVPFASKAKE